MTFAKLVAANEGNNVSALGFYGDDGSLYQRFLLQEKLHGHAFYRGIVEALGWNSFFAAFFGSSFSAGCKAHPYDITRAYNALPASLGSKFRSLVCPLEVVLADDPSVARAQVNMNFPGRDRCDQSLSPFVVCKLPGLEILLVQKSLLLGF